MPTRRVGTRVDPGGGGAELRSVLPPRRKKRDCKKQGIRIHKMPYLGENTGLVGTGVSNSEEEVNCSGQVIGLTLRVSP